MNDRQMQAYSDAVKSGMYAKRSGLIGKYDNVRKYWEDEISRSFLRPHLVRLIKHCRSQMRRLRIMDLGCGSADGYELLAGIRQRLADLHTAEVDLLTPDILGTYKGVDLNADLLDQARTIYGDQPKMVFQQANFTQGLPLADDEPSYDLYFSSFGTSSHHNDDGTMIDLLAQIAARTESYAIVVCDWIGRFSYEWQDLWVQDPAERLNMDYVVSYIYEKEEREAKRDELQHLTLRLVSRSEAEHMVSEASSRAGVAIEPLCYYDRSIFTGRHMDTGDYNRHAQPIRTAMNSLHETNVRTDLTALLIDYSPKPGFELLNNYFENLQVCWNTLVHYTQVLLDSYNERVQEFSPTVPPPPSFCPAVLKQMMERMRRVVEGIGWLGTGLPRENIIEPQLGYALRQLVCDLQQGQGCAHGLVGIFAIDKQQN
jgi:SAM-dependent methyltransferase